MLKWPWKILIIILLGNTAYATTHEINSDNLLNTNTNTPTEQPLINLFTEKNKHCERHAFVLLNATDTPADFLFYTKNIKEKYSALPNHLQGKGERLFIFSPRLLKWAAYDADGYLIASGKANGGANYCPLLKRACRTPHGAFRIQRKGTASCVSKKFPLGSGGAPMPYCMFFGSGFAVHGSPYISNHNTSHGCIRVHIGAAIWLHKHFMRTGTKILVLPY